MTIKNTIIISAATYFVLNFILWAMGWMIWPVLWIASGYASIKVWEWTMREKWSLWCGLDHGEKVACVILGPIMGIISFLSDGKDCIKWPNWLPSIRNPFIWPEKELDKQEVKE